MLAVLAILVILSLASTALAHDHDPVRTAIDDGATHLVTLQNGDGGWFFVVGDTDCGLGAGVSCPNTFGVTALGLTAAYRVTHDKDQAAAARRAADALVAAHDAAPPCDGNPATSEDRPFTVDVSFLLDGVGRHFPGSKKRYRTVARDWFGCVMADFPSGASRADNRINGRIAQGLSNLGAWDASLDVRAAVAVGEEAYARAEARQIVARAADWDVADPDCVGCETLAKGLFLAATDELRGDPVIRSARHFWKQQLLASQLPDGSWEGDTQTTAYVVMGLVTTEGNKATRQAIADAVAFLLDRQLAALNGGFAVAATLTDEFTEVDGEVLQALVAVRRDHD
jgi:hypothetical protein